MKKTASNNLENRGKQIWIFESEREENRVRKEASSDQWRVLYESATRIKSSKPWEKFYDMDLIGIRRGAEEDTVFYSILGRGGECYGIAVYEGYHGLNSFLMLVMQKSMNLSPEFAMFRQRNLTCNWGNRDELTDKQRKIIKDLGYTYRGKNQWLYFMSFEPGYYPYNLDEAEVLRMSGYMQDLEAALQCYDEAKTEVDFENGNMFLCAWDEEGQKWNYGEAPLPFTSYQFNELVIKDKKLLSDLKQAPKCGAVLEADIAPLGACVTDKKYDRPASPELVVLGDTVSGMVINYKLSDPEKNSSMILAEMVVQFIFQYGAPKEIRVSNAIVASGLGQICDVCGIKLSKVKRLKTLDSFRKSLMGRF